jgi:uncharacterized OB-fold protein
MPGMRSALPAATFYDACSRGDMLVEGCLRCRHLQFYPRNHCLRCGSPDTEWTLVSGNGTVVTFSVVRRAPTSAAASRVPYVIGVVKLDEGPQMLATIVNVDPAQLRPDTPVRAIPSGTDAPWFTPVSVVELSSAQGDP